MADTEKTEDKNFDMIVENKIKEITQKNNFLMPGARAMPTIDTTSVAGWDNVYTRFWDKMAVKEVIAVQAMNNPVGQIHVLKVAYADLDNAPSSQLRIQILKEAVEARTRRLDLVAESKKGDNFAQLMSDDVIDSIVNEITDELLGTIESKIEHAGQVVQTHISKNGAADVITIAIEKDSNQIAKDTQRGPGNFVIVTPDILDILLVAKKVTVAATYDTANEAKILTYVGETAATGKKVYVRPGTGTVITGYKGTGEVDTGLTYAPYNPIATVVAMHPDAMDPLTFEPNPDFVPPEEIQMGFMTRYGTYENDIPSYYKVRKIELI